MPSVSIEQANNEFSRRRTMHPGTKTPMDGEQMFQRRIEIVNRKLPLILPESPSKTPSILLKSKDRRGNRALGQQSRRASELEANATSEHPGLGEIVELMTKNLYERHPSAFSQSPPRPFTATQSTVAILGRICWYFMKPLQVKLSFQLAVPVELFLTNLGVNLLLASQAWDAVFLGVVYRAYKPIKLLGLYYGKVPLGMISLLSYQQGQFTWILTLIIGTGAWRGTKGDTPLPLWWYRYRGRIKNI